jgi:NADH-quinone oxidoreductase subunit G
VQRGRLSVYPPGESREDWKIIRAASEALGRRLPYDTLEGVRARLAQANPVFGVVDRLERRGCADLTGPAGDAGSVAEAPFEMPLTNYWQADAVSRASDTMAECARVYLQRGAQGGIGAMAAE